MLREDLFLFRLSAAGIAEHANCRGVQRHRAFLASALSEIGTGCPGYAR
jgi:hypothetical protein